MENNKDAPEPSEKPSEDPKDIARAMLIAGITDEEVAEETGLSLRSVWGVKGALARSGQIPTRSEVKERERKKPGPAEEAFREEGEGVPFRRARPAHVLIESILNQFGVKDRARSLIVSRAERAGGMHPSELERALMDLDTGLKKREVSYITEEYYLAIQQEEDMSRDRESRSYPMRKGEPRRGAGYPTSYGGRDQPTGAGYDGDLERRPWDRSQRYPDERMLDERRLTDILQRERRNWEEQARKEREQETLGQLREDIGVMATELRNLKDNPPVVQPQGESDYEKMLKHTIERQDENMKGLVDRSDKDRTETKTDLKEQREYYEGLIDKQDARFKEDLDKRGTPYDTSGYKDDSVRLVAEGFHELADVLRSRGSPARIIVEAVAPILSETGPPPRRERQGPASVADLVGPDYVEG